MTIVAFIKTNSKTLAGGEILIKRPHFEAFCECEVAVVYTTGEKQGDCEAYALTDITLHKVDKDFVKIAFNHKVAAPKSIIREYQYDEPEGTAIESEPSDELNGLPLFNIVSDLTDENRVTLPYTVRRLIAEYKCGLFNTATFKARMTKQKFKVVSLVTRGRHEEGTPYTIFRHRLGQLALVSDGKNMMNVYL